MGQADLSYSYGYSKSLKIPTTVYIKGRFYKDTMFPMVPASQETSTFPRPSVPYRNNN